MTNKIITKIKGNIKDKEFQGYTIDYVDIPWYDSGKRIQKLETQGGRTIGIRLGRDSIERGLLQGDVLAVIDDQLIVLNITEEACLVVEASDLKTIAKVCYEIGNRHAPLFYSEDYSKLILPYDRPMQEMLNKLEVTTSNQSMKIHRDRAISSVNTSHHHSHDH